MSSAARCEFTVLFRICLVSINDILALYPNKAFGPVDRSFLQQSVYSESKLICCFMYMTIAPDGLFFSRHDPEKKDTMISLFLYRADKKEMLKEALDVDPEYPDFYEYFTLKLRPNIIFF